MTKRRAIYGTAATSISLARCCPEAQLLFDRLVSQADDQGRLQGDPMLVKAQCMPLIDRATTKRVDTWLGELEAAEMILRYESAGQPLIQIVKWWEHQDWMRHIYASRWGPPEGWDKDRTKGSGVPQDAANPPQSAAESRPDAGEVPPNDGAMPAQSGVSGGGESGDVIEIEASRSGDAREATPPTDLALRKITITHHDLTTKQPNAKAVAMYVDLLKRYGADVVNRAQWNVGASDKADYGFVGRVKEQCQKITRQAVPA